MNTPTNSPLLTTLQSNLESVQQLISSTSQRSGRSPESVRLVAVTKYAPEACLVGLNEIGVRTYGENRPQQLIDRATSLSSTLSWHDSEWHLIGQLQRNKVRAVLPHATVIHSVDSFKLLAHIDRVAGELNCRPQLLLQVNVSGESTKSGFSPEELLNHWQQTEDLRHSQLSGLMTMAPLTENEQTIRQCFSQLRELRDELNRKGICPPLRELSMGMSGDFVIAIEEGATMIRLGSILFEGCPEAEPQ